MSDAEWTYAGTTDGLVTTCDWSLRRPGLCCIRGAMPDACPEPARYAVLFDEGDVLGEHLRCVEHAARDRGKAKLVAMKDYHPAPGYAVR